MSVLSHLTTRSSAAVLSQAEKNSIGTSITTLKSRLDAYFGTNVSSHFLFGSYTRDTILPRSMDQFSDIDYMVVFAEGGYKPQTYLDRLKRFVENKYATSEISQENPTIVLELNHIRFELVPALKSGWAYKIPNGPNEWQDTNPNDVNKALTDANQKANYCLKPVIRLAKYWNANSGYVFDSYGFEKWIVGQWFIMCNNQRDYLLDVFDKLGVPTDTAWRKERVERAKAIVKQVRALEGQGNQAAAETEIKKLIPA